MNNETKTNEEDVLSLMDYRQEWHIRMQVVENKNLILTEAIVEEGLSDSHDSIKRAWISRDDYKPTKAQIRRGLIEENFTQAADWLNKIEKHGMHQECFDLINYLGSHGDFAAKGAVAWYYINTKRPEVKPTSDEIICGVTDKNLGIAFAWLNNEKKFLYLVLEEAFGEETPAKIDEIYQSISKRSPLVGEMFINKMNSDRAHSIAMKRINFDAAPGGGARSESRSKSNFSYDLI